jgi:hypothetical protein
MGNIFTTHFVRICSLLGDRLMVESKKRKTIGKEKAVVPVA